jgi:hypothetical protein
MAEKPPVSAEGGRRLQLSTGLMKILRFILPGLMRLGKIFTQVRIKSVTKTKQR